jgi:hypothetical protein
MPSRAMPALVRAERFPASGALVHALALFRGGGIPALTHRREQVLALLFGELLPGRERLGVRRQRKACGQQENQDPVRFHHRHSIAR